MHHSNNARIKIVSRSIKYLNYCMRIWVIESTVESRLSEPILSKLFDYLNAKLTAQLEYFVN